MYWQYIFTLQNLLETPISSIYLQDNLSDVFNKEETFFVTAISASGTLEANNLFDGVTNKDLITAASYLRPLSKDSVIIDVKARTKYDNYSVYNQAIINATSTAGKIINLYSNDLSNNDPDAHFPKPTISFIQHTRLDIPTAITPNNDGYNDKFIIQQTNNSQITLEIFNRWGVRVYKNLDYKNDWEGKGSDNLEGKELPDGTYFYIVTASGNNMITVSKYSGSVTLHR